MIDARNFRVSNIVPLRGFVLVEVLESDAITPGGIALPEATRERAGLGNVRDGDGPPTPIEGLVRRIGPGCAAAKDFTLGDRVILRRGAGRTVNGETGRTFKLVQASELIAVFV